ncbi:MAG: phosphate acyltransferase PlsX [Chloroflexi bacterium]|nr:phosphate acyltransferase PlsX [Chloroflexota bacterium]
MKIAVDAMGGDYAPLEVVKGAVKAAQEDQAEVLLVGREDAIKDCLSRLQAHSDLVSIIHASQVVECGEPPAAALKARPDSSIAVGLNLVKDGRASAFVSAGNSGAVMLCALLTLGKLEGIERPALGMLYRATSGAVLYLDVGANADCRPSFLLQFAQMGNTYMQRLFGISRPRVALLSNGAEETKGNSLVRESYKLLKESGLNFIGNVEGHEIPLGKADVVVTDGFTGNVVLKAAEGFSEALLTSLRQLLASRNHYRPALRAVARWLDYTEYGGVPLLGVKGNVIIAHGRSNARAIRSAIRTAQRAAAQNVVEATAPLEERPASP